MLSHLDVLALTAEKCALIWKKSQTRCLFVAPVPLPLPRQPLSPHVGDGRMFWVCTKLFQSRERVERRSIQIDHTFFTSFKRSSDIANRSVACYLPVPHMFIRRCTQVKDVGKVLQTC